MTHLPYEIKLTYIIAIIIMMCFVGFIILVVFIYNKRQLINSQQNQLKEAEHQNQLLQKELERQRVIEQERERISHDMHDDLGAGISAIKLQAEFIMQKFNDQDLQQDIEELLKTSQEMNLSMREMMWSLNPKNDTLENFLTYTGAYAEHFLKKSNIAVAVECHQIAPHTILPSPLRRQLFLCIKEAINNVYKHSNASALQLVFRQKDNFVSIDIIDNGIGYDRNKQDGNGMQNMQQRMEKSGGSFTIQPTPIGLHLSFSISLQ